MNSIKFACFFIIVNLQFLCFSENNLNNYNSESEEDVPWDIVNITNPYLYTFLAKYVVPLAKEMDNFDVNYDFIIVHNYQSKLNNNFQLSVNFAKTFGPPIIVMGNADVSIIDGVPIFFYNMNETNYLQATQSKYENFEIIHKVENLSWGLDVGIFEIKLEGNREKIFYMGYSEGNIEKIGSRLKKEISRYLPQQGVIYVYKSIIPNFDNNTDVDK